MKIEILNKDLYSDGLSEIRIMINNNTLSYKRLLNIMLNLKNNKNKIEMFNIEKLYQYDITFLKLDILYFYNNRNEIENEIENLIENEIKNTNINENDNELFNEFQYTLNENELKIINKHNHFQLRKLNEINNKKIDLIENKIDLIKNKENEIKFKYPKLVSSLIRNRKIGNLNKLLFKNKLRNEKLFKNDKKKLLDLRLFILNLIENENENENKDIYNLLDYYELDYENEFNSLYDYDILKNEYEIDINENEKFYINEYKEIENNPKRNKDLIRLVYSLH